MKKEIFKINHRFFTHAGEWLCTDVGTRTIAAVKYKDFLKAGDNYPPYSVAEYSFDEYDMEGCWQASDFEGVDLETFELISDNGEILCRDKNNLYKNDERLDIKGDIETYVDVNSSYSKDNLYVYYDNKVVEGADVDTISNVHFEYVKDKNHVYVYGHSMPEYDAQSFELVEPYIFKDKHGFYFGAQKVENLDIGGLEKISENFYRNKDKLYHFNKNHFIISHLEGIDMKSFKIINDYLVRDTSYDYLLRESAWIKKSVNVLTLRHKLEFFYTICFDAIEKLLFKHDLMHIAQEGYENEYALERDEILVALPCTYGQEKLQAMIKYVFEKNFDAAASSINNKRYSELSHEMWDLWQASKELNKYQYLEGRTSYGIDPLDVKESNAR